MFNYNKSIFLLIFYLQNVLFALDNGLVRTPPMGWMSWTKFLCETDCEKHPFSCINENLYKVMADKLIEDKYSKVGYNYIHIDDCWMEKQRDSNGYLVADKNRFPSGIKSLANYMHQRGLKLGIYGDYGNLTCGGYPGSYNYLKIDALTFAKWKVDYLKLDGCNVDVRKMKIGYPKMEKYLNFTGQPIVYSCSWPAYLINNPKLINYKKIAQSCNLWRNYNDIEISWNSILSIIKYYNLNQNILSNVHGPGHWNDPDMLVIGNTGITVDQAKAQMSVWCIWSAPLIMSNDLRTITPEHKKILLNQHAIAINQDPLGKMGRLVYSSQKIFIYTKPITPCHLHEKECSYAVVILNHSNKTQVIKTNFSFFGLTYKNGYEVFDIWNDHLQMSKYYANSVYQKTILPTSADFFKAILIKSTTNKKKPF